MGLSLLILDEKADAEEIAITHYALTQDMREKHKTQGVNVLANDDAITGKESELRAQGIEFFPRWQTNPTYRELLRQALKSGEVYVMKMQGQRWTYVRASEEDYEVLNPIGNTNIRPRTR